MDYMDDQGDAQVSQEEQEDNPYQNMSKFIAQRKAYAQQLQGQLVAPLGQGLYDPQLRDLSGVESDSGTNTRGPAAVKGVNAGSHAIGQFQMMPGSVKQVSKDLTNKQSDLYKSLPPELEEPDVAALRDLDNTQLKSKLESNPDLQNKVARLMYQSTVAKHGNNPLVNQYTWLQGPNTSESKITPEAMLGNDVLANRTKKFLDLQQQHPQDIPQEQMMDPRFQKLRQMIDKNQDDEENQDTDQPSNTLKLPPPR